LKAGNEKNGFHATVEAIDGFAGTSDLKTQWAAAEMAVTIDARV
jgi:hypothetical protein